MDLRRLRILLGALLILLVPFSLRADERENRDLIIVIDVSVSMRDRFDGAQIEAKRLVSSAKAGDRVTLITFGGIAHLLERKRIKSPYDVARLVRMIDELEANEYSTNLPLAMERGLGQLREFYEENPEGERLLLWLSDGKNNPPREIADILTFQSLKQKEINRVPDKEWFSFDSPMEAEAESDVDWFVDWAKRVDMVLTVEPLTNDVGSMVSSNPTSNLRVRFEPNTPAIWGTTFSVVAEAVDEERGNYTEKIFVDPSIIVCKGSPWEQLFRLKLPERPGEYVCKVSFVFPSDKLLRITPARVAVAGRVRSEKRTLAKRDTAVETATPENSSKLIRDTPSKRTPVSEGNNFRMNERIWKSLRDAGIFIREQFAGVLATEKPFFAWLVALVLGGKIGYSLLSRARKSGLGRTELAGTLEVVTGPAGCKKDSYNLKRMGRFRGGNSLTIGRNGEADIVLPHASIAAAHAEITATRTDAGVVVFIQPVNGVGVGINGAPCEKKKEIVSGDLISMGAFLLRYKGPEISRETIVEFTDGNCIKGTLLSWDIEAPGFVFFPEGAPYSDARMAIDFSEVKKISFLARKKPLRRRAIMRPHEPRRGYPVQVLFEDGELIEGHMIGENNEWSKRFYLIPEDCGEIALILVERSAAKIIDVQYALAM